MKIEEKRVQVPPFTMESTNMMVQMLENIWNTKDPEKVGPICTIGSEWRDRTEFMKGRDEIKLFLEVK